MAYQEVARDKPALPEYLARKGGGKMDDDEFHAVVQHAISQSAQFVDNELSVDRAKATDYYKGKPFGNEEEGRSQVVLTEVRDAILGMLPSLLRVFFGSEHAVEFVPTRADNVEQAAQKTDYVRYVFEEDNAGFLRTLAVLKDGLTKQIGIFKWGWDSSVETKAYKQQGIDRQQLELLAADDSVTLGTTVKQKPDPTLNPPPQPGQPPAPLVELYDVEFTRTNKGGRARIWEIPPEEFIFNRQARECGEALLVGHRTEKTRGQLLAMGVKEKDIDEHAGASGGDVTLRGNAEDIARRDTGGVGTINGSGFSNDPEMGKANDKILYTEAFMTIDFDGDGRAELRKICTIGPTYYPVENDPTDERPFAIFTPDPEPHALLGGSIADRTMDIQRINSALLRGMLDSLSASIFPRTAYLEGQASVADIMNTAIGAPMRERVAGAIRTLEVPFVGKEAMPILGFMQEVIERRTGQNKGVAGLDDDALQSTGKEAVGAVLTASQAQIEMVARVFAEMTLKPMFAGVGRLLQTHQPRARMVRLRGQWVDVDPRTWNADMDVTVNVGLGSTFTEKKVQTLMLVAADQHEIITTMGPDNPVVSLAMWRNTRAKILSLQGIKDVDSYYKPIDPNWQPPAPPPPPPDPNVAAMEAEKEMNRTKVIKELAIKQDELALEREKFTWQQEMDIRKLAADVEMKKYVADAQNKITLTQAQLDHQLDTETRETELTFQAHDQLHDQSLERSAQDHEQSMNERAADTADNAQEADAQAAQTSAEQPAGGGE